MIRRNVEMETRLIDDLLDLTRVSRGKLTIDPRLLDVHDAIRRAAEVCMSGLSEKRLHLRMRSRRRTIMCTATLPAFSRSSGIFSATRSNSLPTAESSRSDPEIARKESWKSA